jgi:hypothetical protein
LSRAANTRENRGAFITAKKRDIRMTTLYIKVWHNGRGRITAQIDSPFESEFFQAVHPPHPSEQALWVQGCCAGLGIDSQRLIWFKETKVVENLCSEQLVCLFSASYLCRRPINVDAAFGILLEFEAHVEAD